MAHTNETVNLGLPQFVSGDKGTWLGDLNGAFSKIDENAGEIGSDVASAVSTANNAKATADAAAADVSALSADVAGAVADVAHLSGDIDTINSLIGNGTPTTTDKTIIGAINELDADISGITTPTAAEVPFTPPSGMVATNVQDAIEEVASGGGGSSSNVRWNETTDHFEVLYNGSWVQSIRAFVKSIAVWAGGVFGISISNGVYAATSIDTATAWNVSGNNLACIQPSTNTVGVTLVSDDAIDLTNYTKLKIAFDGLSPVELNISSSSDSAYLYVFRDSNKIGYGFSSSKTNFVTNQISGLYNSFSQGAGTVAITEITIE